jgi:hypothetical protein
VVIVMSGDVVAVVILADCGLAQQRLVTTKTVCLMDFQRRNAEIDQQAMFPEQGPICQYVHYGNKKIRAMGKIAQRHNADPFL